jgi:hypothetical protein
MFTSYRLLLWMLACFTFFQPSVAAGTKSRIVFHTLNTLALARLDPIIAPGNMSQQSVSSSLNLHVA